MTIRYLQFTVAIHGLEAENDTPAFLVGWLKEATKAALLGSQRERFRFRNEFDSDISVSVTEAAGSGMEQSELNADSDFAPFDKDPSL